MNKIKSILLILFCFFSFYAYTQKCKMPLLFYENTKKQTFKEDYKFSKIKYQNDSIVSLSFSNLTIKELIEKVTNKTIKNIIYKDKILKTQKISFLINCNSDVTEKMAKNELMNFIIDFYNVKIVYDVKLK